MAAAKNCMGSDHKKAKGISGDHKNCMGKSNKARVFKPSNDWVRIINYLQWDILDCPRKQCGAINFEISEVAATFKTLGSNS